MQLQYKSEILMKKNQDQQVFIPQGQILYEQTREKMMEHFKYKNIHQIPKIIKVTLHIGLSGRKDYETVLNNLALITGQKAVLTKAKKSISQFNVRAGQYSGAKVSLTGKMLYNFFSRFMAALISWNNFQGFNSKSINLNSKYAQVAFGIPDITIFAGLYSNKIKGDGLDILFTTTCQNKEECIFLFNGIKIPFKSY